MSVHKKLNILLTSKITFTTLVVIVVKALNRFTRRSRILLPCRCLEVQTDLHGNCRTTVKHQVGAWRQEWNWLFRLKVLRIDRFVPASAVPAARVDAGRNPSAECTVLANSIHREQPLRALVSQSFQGLLAAGTFRLVEASVQK